jgi:uncharacterized membrane protein YesL
MKTMKGQYMETWSTPDAPWPARVLRLIWEHMSLLLCADLLLCLALVPPALAWLIGWPLLAPWVAALTLGPTWAACVLVAQRLVSGETATWRDLCEAGRRHWRAAVGVSLVPALLVTLLLGTWSILAAHPRMIWLYLPLFVDGCMVTLALLASFAAFSLRVERGLRGLTLWKVALAITALRPARLVLVLAFFFVLALLLGYLSAGLLPLLGAPLAVCLAAIMQQTSLSLRQRETLV